MSAQPTVGPRRTVIVAEAKAHLSELLKAVEAGEVISITRRGEPVATLAGAKRPRKPLDLDWLRRHDRGHAGARGRLRDFRSPDAGRGPLLMLYLDTSVHLGIAQAAGAELCTRDVCQAWAGAVLGVATRLIHPAPA